MIKSNRFIDVTTAMNIAQVSRPTIIRWCERLRIGIKVGGRWKVDKVKLIETMNGERTYEQKK